MKTEYQNGHSTDGTVLIDLFRVDRGGHTMSLWATMRTAVFGIREEEADFERRGFETCALHVRGHLERVGQTFIKGYNLALRHPYPPPLASHLQDVEPMYQGFAFEGAAMGLALLDCLSPSRRSRWNAFLEGPGSAHVYMLHVGVGWAAARLPWVRRRLAKFLTRFDPLLRWLIVDGYGFHQGYFQWPHHIRQQELPAQLTGYQRRVFDQGLGRSLWFVVGASATRLEDTITSFPSSRRADLWGGVGLACAYAGGMDAEQIKSLCRAAAEHRTHLAQGVAFATKARVRANNVADHTHLACEIICKKTLDMVDIIVDSCQDGLPEGGNEPAYELWRSRVREHFAGQPLASANS